MFKKVSWIVALLAALSLAVVFVGCGPEPEEPPPPEFEKGDVLFSLAGWIEDKGFDVGDDITEFDDIDPIKLSGGGHSIEVTAKNGLYISNRAHDYDTIDLKMDELKPYFVKYRFELEVKFSGTAANGYKMGETGGSYRELKKSEEDAKQVTLTWEVIADYPYETIRFQPTTDGTANFTLVDLTLTFLGERE